MTQDNSTKKAAESGAANTGKGFFTSAMVHNGIMGFKNNFKLAIVLFVLHMAAAPLTISMLIAGIFSTGRADVDNYGVIAVLTTGAAAMAGILCALSAMPYLYKKSVVDMRLSLPMTTLQRFVSDFLSGLSVYVLPFAASSIISLLLTLAGHIACDGKTFYTEYEPRGSGYGWECNIFEEYAPVLIKGIIGGILLMIMFYTLTLLVSSCCGSVFECVCYTLLANGLIPGSIAMAIFALLGDINNLAPESYLAMVIPYTSPVGGCIGLVYAIQNGFENQRASGIPMSVTYGKWLAVFALVTLLLIICTYLIYRRRKAEDTGNPIVFGALFHVVMTLGTACIVYAFMYSAEDVIPMIIITAIIYFVFSVIRRRGFKKFWRSALSYVCTIFVCIGSYVLVTETEAFGAAKYVPGAGSVSAAYVNYSGIFEDNLSVDFTGFETYSRDIPLKLTERAALEIITDVHRSAVGYFDGVKISSRKINVMYRMRSGRLVVRNLTLTDEDVLKLCGIDQMSEAKEYRANKARETAGELYYPTLEDKYSDSMNDSNRCLTLSPQWRLFDENNGRLHEISTVRITYLPEDFLRELGECIYKDIAGETEEDYFTDPHGIMQLTYGADGNYRSGKGIVIRSYYTNTLEYLRSCGFKTDFEISKTFGISSARLANVSMVSGRIVENMTGKNLGSCTALNSALGIFRIENGENYEIQSRNYYSYSLFDYVRAREGKGITEDLYTVLANSYKQYKTDETCYTIIVNGNAAVIDPRYNEAAERLFINLTVREFVYKLTDYDYTGRSQLSSEEQIKKYKAFLNSFLTCYGREKIDSVSQYGAYDLMLSFINSQGNEIGVYWDESYPIPTEYNDYYDIY